MYLRGLGVPASDTEAAAWFERAADQGSTEGQINLARMYQDGLGVARNDDKARELLDEAAQSARRSQPGIPILQSAQIAEATRRAGDQPR